AQVLGVKEYFLYDLDHRYLQPSLRGYRLAGNRYVEIQPVASRLTSEILGLEFGERDGTLGLHNPQTQRWLLSPAEARQQAEARAQQESQARQQAEAELAQLRAELERLRASQTHSQ
ncbi:MAG: hypothetical protein O7E52_27625, partial [Candidatus Poribacteria bacterium]|nr:hypothetical protein [Candidatus Poribacteria bacterium]